MSRQWPVVSHVILLPRTDKRIFETKAKIVACGFPQCIEIFKIWIFGLSLVKTLHYLKGNVRKVIQIIFKG